MIEYDGNKLVLPEIQCACGLNHTHPDMDIYIGQNIIQDLPKYLNKRNLGSRGVLVTDNVVYPLAAAKAIGILRQAGFQLDVCILEREHQLIPNEAALGEVLLTLTNETELLIGVGSGSVTDLTRYAAHLTGKPFVAVGTAPSMDGYTSVVAPLTLGNLKVNKPAGYPQILVCDLEVFRKAPEIMVLSGFGDVVGKYIAKADWILGNIVNDEPLCPLCLEMITWAIDRCMDNIEGIKDRTLQGIRSLTEGLIIAGITILIVGHTRPVASNEHSMAHYWEMMKMLAGQEPPRHGLSVGSATVYALKFYELFLHRDLKQISVEQIHQAHVTQEERNNLIVAAFGETIGKAIIRDNGHDYLTWSQQLGRANQLKDNQDLIRAKLAFLPGARQLIDVYAKLNYPWQAEKLGIDQELLVNSLLYAKEYRDRYTVFKSAAELGILLDLVAQVRAIGGKEEA